ncbi:bacteriocin-like protein [Chryseobacterium sp. CH1]|uniref:bacteriocin-like protein n=1 Tax=unclassified Chryseobacterium TaxID=2593645 RepID=UPI0026B204D7
MKNLKKLNRENLKKVNGGSDTCSYCGISQICATGCFGEPICLPRGPYFPTNC